MDGNLIDMATVVVALLCIFIKPVVRKLRRTAGIPCWVFRDVVNDLLNGATVVPFAMLFLSIFSHWMLEETLKTAKLSMAVAGAIGLLYVFREMFSPNGGFASGGPQN